ncbi:MAG: DUF885 family protein [Bacillota bacterium]
MRPSTATALGDHRFDDRLDDVSAGARLGWAKQTREALDALPRRVSFGKLSRAGQIDYEILEHHLRRSLWLTEQFKPFVTDPRSYSGLVSGTVFSLLTQSTLPLDKNVANSVARIRQILKVIAAARESLGVQQSVIDGIVEELAGLVDKTAHRRRRVFLFN